MSTPTPVKVAPMTPASDREGVKVLTSVLHLDDLPKAMDRMGWTVSAQLMRRWFETKPAWAMSIEERQGRSPKGGFIDDYTKLPSSQVEEKIVTMAWARKYDVVNQAIAKARQEWNSDKSMDLLIGRLKKKGWVGGEGRPVLLGSNGMSAKQLDTECQVNLVKFGGPTERLDDFFGAIFRASMKVALVGQAYHDASKKKDFFRVDHLGFYIRDTYDFNAGWFDDAFMGLGVWSKDRVLSKAEMADYRMLSLHPFTMITQHMKYPGFVPVRNADFRRWQAQHNSGGDFFVFSDVLWEPYHGEPLELPASEQKA
jgi:hypothetical protein